MTNYTNYSEQERLENIFGQTPERGAKKTSHFSLINRIWQYIVTAMVQGHEPQVWQSTDRNGYTWWHGYDPITDNTVCLESETEMRIWLEGRYYQ